MAQVRAAERRRWNRRHATRLLDELFGFGLVNSVIGSLPQNVNTTARHRGGAKNFSNSSIGTLIVELTLPNLAAFETSAPRLFADKDWQANYHKMVPLVESGHREIFTIVE